MLNLSHKTLCSLTHYNNRGPGMTFVTQSTRKFGILFTYLRFKVSVFGQILRFLQNLIFADLTLITPHTSEKEARLIFITSSTRKFWLYQLAKLNLEILPIKPFVLKPAWHYKEYIKAFLSPSIIASR